MRRGGRALTAEMKCPTEMARSNKTPLFRSGFEAPRRWADEGRPFVLNVIGAEKVNWESTEDLDLSSDERSVKCTLFGSFHKIVLLKLPLSVMQSIPPEMSAQPSPGKSCPG